MPLPFGKIPGPKTLPLIGTLHHYLPYIGKYNFKRLHRNGALKYKEFGPLVRENLFGDVHLLYVFEPEDIAQVLSNDGQYPFRRSHIALQKYRLDRPQMYSSGGLLPTNGEEWLRLRREAQKVITRIPCVRSHLPIVNEICSEFVRLIKTEVDQHNSCELNDFNSFLEKLFLELTMQTTVDHRFNCLDPNTSIDNEASQLLWASKASTKSILRTDNGIPFWKWFDTPLYKQLTRGQDIIYRIALKYINEKEQQLQMSVGKSAKLDVSISLTPLEYFLLHSDLSKTDVITIVCDSLLAGTDTSSYTTSFILYHVAKHSEKQEKLSEEASILLKESGGIVTNEVLNKATYTKAAFKESLRMNPISVGIGRISTKDFVLRNFHIPEGTVIITQNQVSCRQEKYFDEPDSFIPERWLKKSSGHKNPYVLLPFGHGPRSCIGRRLAEQNIYSFLLQFFNHFKISWKGKDLDCYSYLINEPDSKLNFEFSLRK